MPSSGTICAQPGIYTSDCHRIRATIREGNRFPACRRCKRFPLDLRGFRAATANDPGPAEDRAIDGARDPSRGTRASGPKRAENSAADLARMRRSRGADAPHHRRSLGKDFLDQPALALMSTTRNAPQAAWKRTSLSPSPSPSPAVRECASAPDKTVGYPSVAECHRTALSAASPGTVANSRQVPGTPLSSCSPRSTNSMVEPATRSTTVVGETRISFLLGERGDASSDVHMSPARFRHISHSPLCSPARTSRCRATPCLADDCLRAPNRSRARRTRRKPSPVVLISPPWNRCALGDAPATSCVLISLPFTITDDGGVGSSRSMSVNTTVLSTRSTSGVSGPGNELLDLVDHVCASWPTNRRWKSPGNSTYFASPRMWSAIALERHRNERITLCKGRQASVL